jgi:hypothetical protein
MATPVPSQEEVTQAANAKKVASNKAKTPPPDRSDKSTKKAVSESKSQKRTAVTDTALNKAPVGSTVDRPSQDTHPPDYYRDGRLVEKPAETPGEQPTKVYSPAPRSIMTLGADGTNYKKDSLCTLRVITGIGTNDKPHKEIVPPYTKFFLTNVQAPRSERYQVIETFGDWYIFFYGEAPPVYTFSGVVLNTPNYNWLNEFDFFYDAFIRGTAATRNVTRVYVTYGYQQVQGHILNFAYAIDAETDMAVRFTFSMVVVKRFALSADTTGVPTDSFITSLETIQAFQKLIDKDKKRSFNYSMLTKIMNAKAPPANADVSKKKEAVEELTKRIAKVGLNSYTTSEGGVA